MLTLEEIKARMLTIEEIKARTDLVALISQTVKLKKVGSEFIGLCPFHNDTKPSLSVNAEKQQWHCHGCGLGGDCFSWLQKLKNIDFKEASEMLHSAPIDSEKKKIIATYDYEDADGKLLFQVVRYEPKSFAQRQPDEKNGWIWNLKGIKPVLYHLPDILRAHPADTIYIVEGEKCCDALWENGLVSTTSPGGASNWHSEYAEYLMGLKVVIIPDNDDEGLKYARTIVRSLQGKAREIRAIILPGLEPKEDIVEWLERGGTVEELSDLERDISVLFTTEKPNYTREFDIINWTKGEYRFLAEWIRQEKTGVHAKISIYSDFQVLAWSTFNIERSEDRTRLANQVKKNDEELRRNLDLFCAGLWDFYISGVVPEIMIGSETLEVPKFLLYPYILDSGGSILFSAPGRGKSYTALIWAQSINTGISKFWQVSKEPVLFINLERSKQSLKRRLSSVNKILGLNPEESLLVFNARGKALSELAPAISKAVSRYGIKLIVLDSISRAGYGDLTENRPVNLIIDTLNSFCPTWCALAHTPRASEEHIYGGIHFDAGADIVIQLQSQAIHNSLGLSYSITKSNDLPHIPSEIWALEFKDWQLESFRPAKPFEFPDIEAKRKSNMLDEVTEFILNQDSADATATEIENGTGHNRVNITKLLNQSGKFVKTRKIGRNQYYGVQSLENV